MSRMTSRSSPSVCARAARGPSSALTAGQSTPFIVGSKCESRMMVQAASNVSLPLDACAAGTAAAAARANGRPGPQASLTSRDVHLTSALICAGTENTAGSTLPYSTAVIDMTICVFITLTFVVAGWSRLPNFL